MAQKTPGTPVWYIQYIHVPSVVPNHGPPSLPSLQRCGDGDGPGSSEGGDEIERLLFGGRFVSLTHDANSYLTR
ncbi:hypothetical protein ColTof3_06311 [Colletotrichum tofieldiae]|nr:hypothetical protein ColTof3_06311 [Colletotrichum tofieldiae]